MLYVVVKCFLKLRISQYSYRACSTIKLQNNAIQNFQKTAIHSFCKIVLENLYDYSSIITCLRKGK